MHILGRGVEGNILGQEVFHQPVLSDGLLSIRPTSPLNSRSSKRLLDMGERLQRSLSDRTMESQNT